MGLVKLAQKFTTLDVATKNKNINKMKVEIANSIRNIAKNIDTKKSSSIVNKIIKKRIFCPVDYMRYPEFSCVLDFIEIKENDNILDVSSPQWFSIFLASKYPKSNFYYLNIIDEELDPFKEIVSLLELKNISYIKGDCRKLNFDANFFDTVISISVIEHIYPEVGGDKTALDEIYRVLKDKGSLVITVPFKENRTIVYIDGAVYERKNLEKNFFAREYDMNMFNELVESTKFEEEERKYISEKKGFLSLDYYQWGPGKDYSSAKKNLRYKKKVEKLLGSSIEGLLARKYLSISESPKYRLVNICAKLSKD